MNWQYRKGKKIHFVHEFDVFLLVFFAVAWLSQKLKTKSHYVNIISNPIPSLEHFKKVISKRGVLLSFQQTFYYHSSSRAIAFGCQTKLFDAFNPAVSEAWYVIQLYIATAFGLLSFCKVAIITWQGLTLCLLTILNGLNSWKSANYDDIIAKIQSNQ